MVDVSPGQCVIAMSCLACEVGLSAIVIDASVFLAITFCIPDGSQVAACMEEEAMAFHHGKENSV